MFTKGKMMKKLTEKLENWTDRDTKTVIVGLIGVLFVLQLFQNAHQSEDIYKSIDQAVSKLERQLKKYKQKNYQQFDKTETIKTELTQ